jgi:predicted dienelactone hydrolase
MKFRLLFLLFLVVSPALSHAADDETLADLHEQVVQVPVRVEGLFGAKDVTLAATMYRPDGNGPFPLIVLSHGTAPNVIERAKIGRYRRIPQIDQ